MKKISLEKIGSRIKQGVTAKIDALKSKYSTKLQNIKSFVSGITVKEKEDAKEKKDLFALFEGEDYKEKRNVLLSLQEPENDIEDAHLLRLKNLFDSSFETFIRVVTIWYNKLGTDKKSIDKALMEFFDVAE